MAYPLLVPFRRQFPFEVEEHIIDQLCHNLRSLRSCALTCHAWHTHCRVHMFQGIRIIGRAGLDEVCSVLDFDASLGALVQSIAIQSLGPGLARAIPASDLLCTRLLRHLPNIRRCTLVQLDIVTNAYHPLMLTYLRSHSNIETLCLRFLNFSSPASLVRLLTALPRLTHLECGGISFTEPTPASSVESESVHRMKTRRLSLCSLHVRVAV